MNTRRITLIVAVVLALATGFLTLRYLTGVKQESQVAVVASVPVIIAARDIPARTKITPDMLTRVMKPQDTLEAGSIDDPKLAIGDVSLIPIPSGSAVTNLKIGQPAAIGVSARLKKGYRAVTIPVDMVKSVAGLIAPGDHVDVLASIGRLGNRPPVTRAIIRGAIVLALNSDIGQSAPVAGPSAAPAAQNAPAAPSTVTLAITAAQADLLTVADINSTIRLALRPPDEHISSEPTEPLSLVVDAVQQQQAIQGPVPQNVPAPYYMDNGNVPNPGAMQPGRLGQPGSNGPVKHPIIVINGDQESSIPQ